MMRSSPSLIPGATPPFVSENTEDGSTQVSRACLLSDQKTPSSTLRPMWKDSNSSKMPEIHTSAVKMDKFENDIKALIAAHRLDLQDAVNALDKLQAGQSPKVLKCIDAKHLQLGET
eukprot:903299-Amorphochlora_amoeboformis.AAC.1